MCLLSPSTCHYHFSLLFFHLAGLSPPRSHSSQTNEKSKSTSAAGCGCVRALYWSSGAVPSMAGLGFEETELRLGLPGGNDAGDAAAARKRGFEETIDLKLKLEQPAAPHLEKEEEAGAGDAVAPGAVPLSSPPAASTAGAGTAMKRSPSQSSVVTADAPPDPEKPRAPKYVLLAYSIFLFSFSSLRK